MGLCVPLSLCLSLCDSMSVSLPLPISPSLHVSVSVSASLSASLSLSLSLSLWVSLCLYLFSRSLSLSLYLSISISICRSVCMYLSLSRSPLLYSYLSLCALFLIACLLTLLPGREDWQQLLHRQQHWPRPELPAPQEGWCRCPCAAPVRCTRLLRCCGVCMAGGG